MARKNKNKGRNTPTTKPNQSAAASVANATADEVTNLEAQVLDLAAESDLKEAEKAPDPLPSGSDKEIISRLKETL